MNYNLGIRTRLEFFLASQKGKRILNLFYSWGAAFVVLGAMFKILHIRFGNEILFVSMMVEFLVFFISGFEAPSSSYQWEKVFPELTSDNPIDREEMLARREALRSRAQAPVVESSFGTYSNEGSDPTRVIPEAMEADLSNLADAINRLGQAADQLARIGAMAGDMIENYEDLSQQYRGLGENSKIYFEQMEALARNVSGLNTIYEIQLKGISSQIDSIDRINTGLHRVRDLYEGSLPESETFRQENEKMAQQLRQLNAVYARMLEALTTNMGMPGAPHTPYADNL